MVVIVACFCQSLNAQEISSFTLMNAKEDIEIGVLSDGDSIHIPDIMTNEFSIRANVIGKVGSILFELDGEVVGADNRPAYALLGNPGNDYTSWVPEMRTYIVTGSAYSLPQGGGLLLDTYSTTVTFTDDVVIEQVGPTVQSLVLINADTDEDIAEITEGSVFFLDEIGTSNLNIRANVDPETKSVVFGYQDSLNYHTENLPEYAIGANDDSDYRPWIADLGPNTVSAQAFSKNKGLGLSGEPYIVNFEVLEIKPDTIPNFVLRLNSGGETVVVNDSITYLADSLFVGNGKPYANTKIIDVLETTQDSIYKTERTSNGSPKTFGYKIPVENGTYEVNLHFAEIYWGATGGGAAGEGKRVFSVLIEGDTLLSDFDMSAEKQAMTAIVKTFSTVVGDGELNIDFEASVDQPKIAALEIFGSKVVEIPSDCIREELAASSIEKAHSTSVKVDEKLFVIGIMADSLATAVTEIYDTASDTWSQGTPIPINVSDAGAVGVEEEIWIIGSRETDSLARSTDRVQIYNTIKDTWSVGPSVPNKIATGAAAFNDGKIHLFGGIPQDSISDLGEHYVLDIDSLSTGWTAFTPLPDTRTHFGATAANGKIYALGGVKNTLDSTAIVPFVDVYDPLLDSWTRKADLPTAISNFESGTAVYGNKILIVEGQNEERTTTEILEYDIESDSWSTFCRLPLNFTAPSAKVFGDRLIVAGSFLSENDSISSNTISIALEPEMEIPDNNEVKILVYHETGEFRHGSIQAGIDMVNEFGEELDWTVNDSQTSEVFVADSLATYDVVIWMNTTGDDILTASEELAFEEFIRNGGGFVGVHSATDTYRNGSWPWYNDLVGGIVQVKPYHTANNTNAIIDVVGEHPSVTHLGAEWNKNEEYYYWERNGGYLFDGNIDLLKVRSTGPNSYDAARPVTWYKEYDGGRSFYTALGHNASDYESNIEFRTMLKEAIMWAATRNEPIMEDEPIVEEEAPESNIVPIENSIINIFPNPVLNELTVASEVLDVSDSAEVTIYGLDGSLRKQRVISPIDNRIEVNDLPKGYYVLSVKTGTFSEQQLFYKE